MALKFKTFTSGPLWKISAAPALICPKQQAAGERMPTRARHVELSTDTANPAGEMLRAFVFKRYFALFEFP